MTTSKNNSCPFSGFKPFDPSYQADPYPHLEQARAEHPVFFDESIGAWVITRYADIEAALKDHRRFSSVNPIWGGITHPPEVQAILDEALPLYVNIPGNTDPPKHTQVRSRLNRALSPRRVARFESDIRELTDRLIDSFLPDGHTDIVKQLTCPLPMQVICRFLGIPDGDVARVLKWSADWMLFAFKPMELEPKIECARSLVAYQNYLMGLVAQRRDKPCDDFISDLVASIDGQDGLRDEDLFGILEGLIVAGNETTAVALACGLHRLLSERAKWEHLCRERATIGHAVEEIMRYDGAVLGIFRTTTQPVELSGVTIPQGASVYLVLRSAGRDAKMFEQPDTFELLRRNASRHFGFGAGIHFCVGAPLARLEMRVVLEQLCERLPGLRLVQGQVLRYLPSLATVGPQALMVEWDHSRDV